MSHTSPKNFAALGDSLLRQRPRAQHGAPSPAAHGAGGGASTAAVPGHPVVGFTAPTYIYQNMRDTDAQTRELDTLIKVYVQRPVFKTSWAAWLADWQKFFAHYQTLSGQAGALLYTDHLNDQANGYANQIAQWKDAYNREKDEKGNDLPSPVSPTPPPPNVNPGSGDAPPPKGFIASLFAQVPWWGWTLGAVGVAGVGYGLYKMHQAQMMVAREYAPTIKELLPGLISPQMGAIAALKAQGRDPGSRMGHIERAFTKAGRPLLSESDPSSAQPLNYVMHSYDPDYSTPEPDFDIASDFEKSIKRRRSAW